MKIWVTGGDPLGLRVADRLEVIHNVVTSDASTDLRVPEQVAPLAAEVEAIVHLATPPGGTTTDEEMLDRSARGAYVIMDEAVKAGVERVVLISSLSCFDDYPAEYAVDETWRPMPRPEAASLAPHMAERTFREFARQNQADSRLNITRADSHSVGVTGQTSAFACDFLKTVVATRHGGLTQSPRREPWP